MTTTLTTARNNLALLAICLGTFMLLVDVTIVTVALPTIRAGLHADLADAQWTIDAYALALAALLLPAGSLADIVGSRRIFVGGLVVFTIGSLLCGLASSGLELAIFRGVQGVGGAAVFATSLALLAQTFTGRDRGLAFGVWGAVGSVSMAVAPLLGGIITTGLSWRWIFFVNVPVGVMAIVVTLVGVSPSRPRPGRRFDLAGSVVLTLGLVAFVFGLIESEDAGWTSATVVGALVTGGILLAAFPVIERARRDPMLDVRLLRLPTFTGGLIAAFGMNASLYAALVYVVIYLQNGLRASALGAGLQLLVITGGSVLASFASGRLSARIPARWLIGVGLALVGAGLLLMIPGSGGPWTQLIPGFAIAGIGGGLVSPALASTAVGVVPPEDAGMAAGVNSTMRQIGVAASVAVLGVIWVGAGRGATTSARDSSALDAVLLVGGGTALVAAALSLILIRSRDIHPSAAGPRS